MTFYIFILKEKIRSQYPGFLYCVLLNLLTFDTMWLKELGSQREQEEAGNKAQTCLQRFSVNDLCRKTSFIFN